MADSELAIPAASTIIVPTGRDYYHCVQAFEEAYSITVPSFDNRRLSAEAGGRQYVRAKGKDVPAYIAEGFADIGLTGTDVCEEQILDEPGTGDLRYRSIGKPMCSFDLLLPSEQIDGLTSRLRDLDAEPVVVATSFPNFLRRCLARQAQAGTTLNIVISSFTPSGSVEVLPRLGVCDAVADLVETGETAEKNGLLRHRIEDVAPAVVWRAGSSSRAVLSVRSVYDGIDRTLRQRVTQVDDPSVDSYTLQRLRNPNLAVKDYGEEAAEFLDAVASGKSDSECSSELADLVFAGLVMARAKGVDVRLGGVLNILRERNASSSLQRAGR